MKYIYILGLEHSGTTLTYHLLSAHPNLIGLGEVAQFFSPTHMQHYIECWGSFNTHDLCSCGERWVDCEFWRQIACLNGAESDVPSMKKYQALINQVKSNYGDSSTIVDSSKSLDYLKQLYSMLDDLGIRKSGFSVLLCVKDPRGFVSSMSKKAGHRFGLIRCIRTLNYWCDRHRNFVDFLSVNDLNFRISTYEGLCVDYRASIDASLSLAGLSVPKLLEVDHNESHIVIGNKNFTLRNRTAIKYDDAWTRQPLVRLAYFFHRKAQRLNKNLAATQHS
jgi:hypothetical protein